MNDIDFILDQLATENLLIAEHQVYGTLQRAVRAWDFAASTRKSADYTASCLMGATEKFRIVFDVTEDKVDPGERDALVRSIAEQDGRNVTVLIEQEGGAAGKDLIIKYCQLLKEFNVQAYKPSQDKELRAQNASSWLQHGLIKFVQGPWMTRFFSQLKAFPNVDHDDMVDAFTSAFNFLQLGGGYTGSIIASDKDAKPYSPEEIKRMPDSPLKGTLETVIRLRDKWSN